MKISTRYLGVLLAPVLAMACGPSQQPAGPVAPQTTTKAKAPSEEPKRLGSVDSCTLQTPLKKGVPGSPGHLIASPINPNGQSELAHLMRRMQAELKAKRADVMAGRDVTIDFFHHRIRCAWPTAASERNAAYDAMAVSYLRAVDAFNHPDPSSPASSAQRFNGVVESCLGCHANTCEGPMVAIRPLKISD